MFLFFVFFFRNWVLLPFLWDGVMLSLTSTLVYPDNHNRVVNY